MKNSTATFFSIIFCVSLLQAQTDTLIKTELDTQTMNVDVIDQLASLRTNVAQQVEQINNILKTLCEAVKASKLSGKEQLCRELNIVCDCMQTIAQALPTMNKQALINLIELNSVVLHQLQAQLIDGNINGLCNFTSTQFTTPKQQTRSFVTIEQLQKNVALLQEQIQNVWALVTAVSLATYSEAEQKTSSLWQKIKNNQNTALVSLSAIAATGLIYTYCGETERRDWINRFMSYSLMALYMLRQKKDSDIAPLAHAWFGKKSLLADAMIATKEFIGSPKEKLPAVHIIANKDMTAKEQIKWAEDQNCAVLKIEKCRDFNIIKNFFALEDGLFKLPLSFFFAYRIKEDMSSLSIYLDNGANGFFKRLADLINGKK